VVHGVFSRGAIIDSSVVAANSTHEYTN